MADGSFDRDRYLARLTTRRWGREAIVLPTVGSTNDEAWVAFGSGAADGLVVVADEQTRGRGRGGRSWHSPPGRSLSLSLLVRDVGGIDALGVLPLAVGLTVVRSLARFEIDGDLKWPNDVLVNGGKVAGILCESRGPAAEKRAVVIGIGVNVAQRPEDFPRELAPPRSDDPARDGGSGSAAGDPAVTPPRPTSLAIEGWMVTREDLAAELVGQLEAVWGTLREHGAAPVVAAWRSASSIWGRSVRARTPSGDVLGIAKTLDDEGRLVILTAGGAEVAVLAGDLDLHPGVRPVER